MSDFSEEINKSRNTITLPYAWVLKANNVVIGGKDFCGFNFGGTKIKSGDVVRLYDYKCRTIVNPKHVAYFNNEMSNSNAERIGQEPEPVVNKIYHYYYDNLIVLNPLGEPVLKDYYTFLLNPHELSGVIKDSSVLI